MGDEYELFDDVMDPENELVPVPIDVEGIERTSKDYVCSMVENLSKFYYDEQFMASHPIFRKRVESDIDSLCILIKMRSVDERTQDSLVRAISGNSGNASLYRALTDVQRTILNIQTKIEETIKSLEAFMKGWQTEIDFQETADDKTESDDGVRSRGTKDFIKKIKEV